MIIKTHSSPITQTDELINKRQESHLNFITKGTISYVLNQREKGSKLDKSNS